MDNIKIVNHPLYRKAKKEYYFERWKWVVWNAFISCALLFRIREHYETFLSILFMLTTLATLLLLVFMPKTKFENSSDCSAIKEQIRKEGDIYI